MMNGPSKMKLFDRFSAAEQRSFALGCLLLVAFAVYANTLRNGFVYDDHHQIEEDPYAQSFKYAGKIFTGTVWSFQGEEGKTNYYRPIMTFGYLLCNKAFQSLPHGFHLVNVLLNCVVVWLIFCVCSMLFLDEGVALIAAGIFALHPIHTEVVAWIAAVTELEMAIFYLGAFILFLRLSLPETKQGRAKILMCIFFVLALLSKEQAITLLVVATLYEHFYRSDRSLTSLKMKISRYAGFWIIGSAYLLFRATVLGGLAPVLKHGDVTWPQVFLSAFALAGQYVLKLFWPHPLLAFYVFHKSASITDPRALSGILMAFLAIGLFVFLWRNARNYSFALLWMALTLAPVLNARWMATNAFTERYLYLPSVGFSVLVAGGLAWSFRRLSERASLARWAYITAAMAVALLAATAVIARNRDWHDDYSLFTQALKVEPHASLVRSDLGVLEWNRQKPDEAERQWRLALVDKPDNVVALANLGLASLEKQRYDEAKAYLQKAIELRPHFAAPHVHLARVYAAQGQDALAETEFRRAVEIYPLSTQARNALGKFYFDHGKFPEAELQYRASTGSLSTPEPWTRLGDIYWRQGNRDQAEKAWRKAEELAPFDTYTHLCLGDVYLATGRQVEAEKEYRAVLLMDPKNAKALEGLGQLKVKLVPAAQH